MVHVHRIHCFQCHVHSLRRKSCDEFWPWISFREMRRLHANQEHLACCATSGTSGKTIINEPLSSENEDRFSTCLAYFLWCLSNRVQPLFIPVSHLEVPQECKSVKSDTSPNIPRVAGAIGLFVYWSFPLETRLCIPKVTNSHKSDLLFQAVLSM